MGYVGGRCYICRGGVFHPRHSKESKVRHLRSTALRDVTRGCLGPAATTPRRRDPLCFCCMQRAPHVTLPAAFSNAASLCQSVRHPHKTQAEDQGECNAEGFWGHCIWFLQCTIVILQNVGKYDVNPYAGLQPKPNHLQCFRQCPFRRT